MKIKSLISYIIAFLLSISDISAQELLPTSTTGQIIHHTYYTLSYGELNAKELPKVLVSGARTERLMKMDIVTFIRIRLTGKLILRQNLPPQLVMAGVRQLQRLELSAKDKHNQEVDIVGNITSENLQVMNIFSDDIWNKFSESMQKIYEGQKALKANLEEALKPLRESSARISEYYAGIEEQLKQVREGFKSYVENTPEQILIIAQHGWFLDLDSELSMPSYIVSLIHDNKIEEADEYLIQYYEENFEVIRKELILRHPKRKIIFEEAIDCHLKGIYNVTIPTLLSQVDGICYDFTGKKYFIGRERNDIAMEFEKLSGQIIEIFLTPIKSKIPITEGKEGLQNLHYTLNRHEVMHGLKTDYGTKTNSLKSLSMLKYFSDILRELK